MDRQFMTERLLLLRGNNKRDNDTFLEMLREDGDFRTFSGVEMTEKNILMFWDYLEIDKSCFYSIFERKHREKMIGYVGIGYQHRRFEAEFYLSKSYRNRGYCTEALQKLCLEAFGGNLRWRNEEGIKTELNIDKLYATTISDNLSAIKVLEKSGFIKEPNCVMLFQIFIDPDDNTLYENDIKICKENEIPMVVMHLTGGNKAPEYDETGLKRLQEIVDYAEMLHIKVAFENTKIKGYLDYVMKNITNQNVGICFDSGHYHVHFDDDLDFAKFKNRIIN